MDVSDSSKAKGDDAILKEMVKHHETKMEKGERREQPANNRQSARTHQTKSTDDFLGDIINANDINSEEEEETDNKIVKQCKDKLMRYKGSKSPKDKK